jgi:hypothetical protein
MKIESEQQGVAKIRVRMPARWKRASNWVRFGSISCMSCRTSRLPIHHGRKLVEDGELWNSDSQGVSGQLRNGEDVPVQDPDDPRDQVFRRTLDHTIPRTDPDSVDWAFQRKGTPLFLLDDRFESRPALEKYTFTR